ncbi:DNA-binding response regulator [Candidatus Parcubacteria bacterium]|nr:MAG: DNA-binding response regulator [Candidatus Parcubacteria bacterium]
MPEFNKKVLIVEDDPDIGNLLAKKFNLEGFEILTAIDGERALEIAEADLPDFIILDILLPKIEGLTVLQCLHDNIKTSKIPVIVLSNLDSQDSFDQVKAIGDYEYKIKSKTNLDDLVKDVKGKLGIAV